MMLSNGKTVEAQKGWWSNETSICSPNGGGT